MTQSVSALAASLGVSASPSNVTSVNAAVTFTAQLAGVAVTPIAPSGKVNFTANGSTIAGCGAVQADATGKATCSTSALAVGSDPIAAAYSGDANFTVAAAGTMTQSVGQLTPIVGVSSSGSIIFGSSVTLTAQLSGVAFTPIAPTGTVGFTSNSNTISGCSSVAVDGTGKALCTTTALAAGFDSIGATYSGDADFTTASATAITQTVANPLPVLASISPLVTRAGGSVFTLTVNGSAFMPNSTVYWGTTALVTTYVNATQLTAQVTAPAIASAVIAAITVETPTPGGGASDAAQFEVDSADSALTEPTFTATNATVTAGDTASYAVLLPGTVNSATVACLNLPAGAACSYSSATNTVTITTTAATPKGTYQVTVVFYETVAGALASWIPLPIFLLPLMFLRKKLTARGLWVNACFGLILLAATAAAFAGCGGAPQTHQVVSSGVVSLTVQ